MEAFQELRHSTGNLHHDTLKEIRTFAWKCSHTLDCCHYNVLGKTPNLLCYTTCRVYHSRHGSRTNSLNFLNTHCRCQYIPLLMMHLGSLRTTYNLHGQFEIHTCTSALAGNDNSRFALSILPRRPRRPMNPTCSLQTTA